MPFVCPGASARGSGRLQSKRGINSLCSELGLSWGSFSPVDAFVCPGASALGSGRLQSKHGTNSLCSELNNWSRKSLQRCPTSNTCYHYPPDSRAGVGLDAGGHED